MTIAVKCSAIGIVFGTNGRPRPLGFVRLRRNGDVVLQLTPGGTGFEFCTVVYIIRKPEQLTGVGDIVLYWIR